MTPAGPLVLAALLAAPAAAHGALFVVDDDGGVGVDFTELQLAIDFATDGDTIQLEPGTYGDAKVTGKGLRIVGAAAPGGARPLTGLIEVRGTGVGQPFVLRGVDVRGPGFRAVECVGTVHVEDCAIEPEFLTAFLDATRSRVERCSGVTFVRCTLEGTAFGSLTPEPSLVVVDSHVHAFDTRILGSPGYDTCSIVFGSCSQGCPGPGGDAIRQSGGLLHLSGCDVRGGDMGCTLCSACPLQTGGDALDIGGAAPLAFALGGALAGGFGGPTGAPVAGDASALATYAGSAHGFDWDAWAPALGPLTMQFVGEAGELALLLATIEPLAFYLPTCSGPIYFNPLLTWLPAGTLDASGTLTLSATAPGLAPHLGALTLFGQGAFFDGAGACVLGPPSALTLRP